MQIELANVEKRFGRVRALKELTLTIPTGRRVALIGPNGSGKSTLTRVLMGLVTHTGSARIDGLDPFNDRVKLADRLAYVPQIAPRLGAPVGEVLQAITTVRGLDFDRLKGFAARLDLNLDAIALRPFKHLSGGMRQKVLIALALTTQANLFILDEPTASLDIHARGAFFRLFQESTSDATVILCSHRLEEIRHMVDHVVALDEGRVAFDGSATAYLTTRSLNVLEVRVTGDAAADWLRQHHFQPGLEGWWVRTVTKEQKLDLVPRLPAALGEALADLFVRDVGTLTLSPPEITADLPAMSDTKEKSRA